MNVRGAPLIALVALLGLSVDLVAKYGLDKDDEGVEAYIIEKIEYLKTSRPTAVNLFNAMDELKGLVKGLGGKGVVGAVKDLAERYLKEDLAANKALGDFGAEALKSIWKGVGGGLNLMTVCNTGSLATSGHGTALGVVRSLHSSGDLASLGVLETRPYNQGARLTAFEAVEEGFPNSRLIVDSATPFYMKSNAVHGAVVGADRVVKNGDTANKIGTYALALHCKYNGIPFFVASPTTTLDVKIEAGDGIEIEDRGADELRKASGAPAGIDTWNPAFDVTPAKLITGIVTEKGVIYPDKDGKFDIVGFLANNSKVGVKAVEPPQSNVEGELLTTDTVGTYVLQNWDKVKAAFRDGADGKGKLESSEINGGNLNYAFVVKGRGGEVFVKQAPDFVKCLGKEAKLHKERMELEVKTYETWMSRCPSVAKFLPKIYSFDVDNETVIMEFFGDCEMLEHRLIVKGGVDERVAKGLGEFMAATHAATHVSKVNWGEGAQMYADFRNLGLRGLQLEYVFSKAWAEGGELAKVLSENEKFMEGVEAIKNIYMGGDGNGGNLALCHGDLHPGSVMINDAEGKVKIIDPEFAIYGPPGLDLGSLLSGVVLAGQHHKWLGNDEGVKGCKKFTSDFLSAYREHAADLGKEMVEGIIKDALGFCACEVGRTALGFAGGRLWLQFDDADLKTRALAATVQCAKTLMVERERGEEVVLGCF